MADTGTTDLVIDANVVLKAVVPEEHSAEAWRVLDRYREGEAGRLLVPEFLRVEVANALWKRVVRGSRPRSVMERALGNIALMGLTAIPTRDLVHAALKIALDRGITAYDAAYVALSDREEVPLVTADRKLLGKLKGTPHRIRWLGDFQP